MVLQALESRHLHQPQLPDDDAASAPELLVALTFVSSTTSLSGHVITRGLELAPGPA